MVCAAVTKLSKWKHYIQKKVLLKKVAIRIIMYKVCQIKPRKCINTRNWVGSLQLWLDCHSEHIAGSCKYFYVISSLWPVLITLRVNLALVKFITSNVLSEWQCYLGNLIMDIWYLRNCEIELTKFIDILNASCYMQLWQGCWSDKFVGSMLDFGESEPIKCINTLHSMWTVQLWPSCQSESIVFKGKWRKVLFKKWQ